MISISGVVFMGGIYRLILDMFVYFFDLGYMEGFFMVYYYKYRFC